MPRLNIYIPDNLDLELRSHPRDINVSKVCAAALRAELSAGSADRTANWLFTSTFAGPSETDIAVMRRFGLRRCLAGAGWKGKGKEGADSSREYIATVSSTFLDRTFAEGLVVGIAGGLQMWGAVRRLQPRNLGMPMWAIGAGSVDHELPHVHANALVTFLNLLYAPRAKAMLVGAPHAERAWQYPTMHPPAGQDVKRILVGSCSPFDADSPYARVLGEDVTNFLVEEHVTGDFLGVFFTPDGRTVEPYPPGMTVTHVAAADLRELSARDDTLVVLAAAGGHKTRIIRQVLAARLCNTLITDASTAAALLRVTVDESDAD
ncbi:MAG: sugar-binding domain-containing protein [Gemmatimonadaceae bacterium]